MTLKKCPCCEKVCTTKNSKYLGRVDEMLWFDCVSCRSTFVLRGQCFQEFKKKFIAALKNAS